MAQYPVPKEIQPLARLMTDFAHACGYDPLTVFNDFLTFVIHGFSPGAPPAQELEIQAAAECRVHGHGFRMGAAHATPVKGRHKLV